MPFSLNIQGKLYEYTRPAVMGILNITPDSLYAQSRAMDEESIRLKASEMADEGADFIDIGAYSTRPGHSDISSKEEISRLGKAIKIIKSEVPDVPVSVDTFRADVAKAAVEEMGADIINDITGGNGDPKMFQTIADLNVPYVLTHSRGKVSDLHENTDYADFPADVIRELAYKVSDLCLLGVNDIIIDPGFGLSKTLEQNFTMLRQLKAFEIFKLPILVGLSRKSMITRPLYISAEDAKCATTAVNTIALLNGASILRVHDVKEACQAIKLTQLTIEN